MTLSASAPTPRWRLSLAVALATLVTLCVELDLTRLISLLFGPNDAYWVVALALLGFGIGGALVAVGARALGERAEPLLPFLLIGTAVSALVPIVVFRALRPELEGGFFPGNALPVLLSVSLPCLLPFLFSSAFLSIVFMRHRDAIARLYCFDLIGSGAGCVAFFWLLRAIGVEYSLVAVAGLGLIAALLVAGRTTRALRAGLALGVLALVGAAAVVATARPIIPLFGRELRMLYDYQADRVQLEFQRWDPVARIDIASVPGHVLHLPDEARFKLLTQDGGAPSILLQFDRPPEELELPERSLLGAAYWPRRADSVLIIGPGGGPDVVVALHYEPEQLSVVELNATTIHVVGERFREFTGDLYGRPGVRVVHDDGRHFVRTSTDRYDVIQLTGVDTALLTSGGNLSENYLYTLEAFHDYLAHLGPDGILSLTYPHSLAWGLRALAMALEAMRAQGVEDPTRHVVVSQSGGYVNLLISRSPFRPEEVSAIRERFDRPLYGLLLPLYYDLWGRYLPPDTPSIYVADPEALARQGLLHDPTRRLEGPYGEAIRTWARAPDSPEFWKLLGTFRHATDDRPFFFLPFDAGERFRVRILWLLVPVLVFLLGPLVVFRRRGFATQGTLPLALYFACLGFAFIALEIVLLQKFVLFLGHPAMSFTVVLGSLLVATGLGSLASERVGEPLRVIAFSLVGLCLYLGLLLSFAEPLTDAWLRASAPARIAIAVAAVAPLGLLLGTFFPSGVRLLHPRAEDFVPWAWGINGSTSVIGTLVSLYLAIRIGFTWLAVVAVAVYLVAGLAARAAARQQRA